MDNHATILNETPRSATSGKNAKSFTMSQSLRASALKASFQSGKGKAKTREGLALPMKKTLSEQIPARRVSRKVVARDRYEQREMAKRMQRTTT